jgi:hypothetical protein
MRKIDLLSIIVLTGMLSSSISVSDVFATASGEEVVHSIFEYDVEYQERARAVVAEMMYHWPEESYVRWRPVRIEPREVLQEEIVSDNAMPASLQLTLFHDMIVSAQRTRYMYIEATGDAIWEGVIPGFENSRVEITIVDTTDKFANTEERIAFVIRIWAPPRHFYILPTDDLDIYVAMEGRVSDDKNVEWAPNY